MLVSNGPYIPCDCSGFISNCWNTYEKNGSGAWSKKGAFGGSNYRARTAQTGIIENDFPGIQEGDCLWKENHVGLYVGNNTTLQLKESNWPETPNKHGGGIYYGSGEFQGFCSFDGSFSKDYDPDDPDFDPDDTVTSDDSGHTQVFPPAESEDGSETGIIVSEQYIKRRKSQMKLWRLL